MVVNLEICKQESVIKFKVEYLILFNLVSWNMFNQLLEELGEK